MASIELPNLRQTLSSRAELSTDFRDQEAILPELRIQEDFQRLQQQQQQEFSLPPADGGIRAWLFLAGSFFVEALVWGLPFSYGLFQDFYTRHEPFKSDPAGVAAIGTSALGIMYLGSPVCFAAMQRWPFIRTWGTTMGVSLLVISLIASSWATQVWHLVLTQGVLYAVGGTLLYSPVIQFVDEWFIRRKGLAFGVMWAGTGFAGVSIPFVMSWLLGKYHLRTTLRAWAVCLVVVSAPLLFVVRARIPTSQTHQLRKINLPFLKNRTFLFVQLGNVLQGLGFFMPTVYLPTYARSLGVGNAAVTATVALLNGAMVFGCIFVGVLIDRVHVTTAIFVCTAGATFSVFVLWGLSASIPVLCVFSVVYGFFAGGFSSTYAGVIKDVSDNHPGTDPGMIVGLLAAGRGIGSVICGPLSEALIKTRPWEGKVAFGYGSGFGPLIVFTGLSAFFGGISFGARRIGWM